MSDLDWADRKLIAAARGARQREAVARRRAQAEAQPDQCPPGRHSMSTIWGQPDSPKDVCWDCDYEVKL